MPIRPSVAAAPPPGLRHAPEAAAQARWADVMAMHGPEFKVGHVVPSVFEAYARLLHPTQQGRRWAEVAAQRGYRITATSRYDDITPRDGDEPVEGYLSAAEASVVAERLRGFTSTPGRCLFLVLGRATDDDLFGDLIFGGNPHVVLTGDVMAATALHAITEWGNAAEAWWPADRSWFVYTNPDGFDTLIGGPTAAIEALIDDDRIEALPIAPDDPVDISPYSGRPN